MRKKIVNLLRLWEPQNGGYENQYSEYSSDYGCEYDVVEFLDYPNYQTIVKNLQKQYTFSEDDQAIFSFRSEVIAELKRMEVDQLILIETQKGHKTATTTSTRYPNFDDQMYEFTTESIILTTKGKSTWKYFLQKAKDNPVNLILSIIAIIISVISLIIN